MADSLFWIWIPISGYDTVNSGKNTCSNAIISGSVSYIGYLSSVSNNQGSGIQQSSQHTLDTLKLKLVLGESSQDEYEQVKKEKERNRIQ